MAARWVAVVVTLGSAGVLLSPPADGAAETCLGEPATIVAGRAEPTFGTAGRDVIVVPRGSGAVWAGGGDDVVCITDALGRRNLYTRVMAGAGDDRVATVSTQVVAEAGTSIVVQLGDGDDEFSGGDESEAVLGGDDWTPDTGSDVITTGAGDDVVTSGLAETSNGDRIDTGDGRDVVDLAGRLSAEGMLGGGPGRDLLWVHTDPPYFAWRGRAGPAVLVDNRAGTLDVGDERWTSWTDFEGFDLSSFGGRDVTVVGGAAAEFVLLGSRGTYDVDLDAGDDLVALAGSFLVPQGRYVGGPGRDGLLLLARGQVRVDLRGSLDSRTSQRHHRSDLTGFEDAWVGARQVRLIGDGSDNRLRAGGLRVVVDGRGGGDRIKVSGRARSVARGGGGHDLLIGHGGDDVLLGGDGRDEARGLDGPDLCDAETRVECEA